MEININEFIKDCGCGRKHEIVVKGIFIEENAINKLPELFHSADFKKYDKPAIICDDNTYLAAGEKVKSLLPQSDLIKLSPDNLHASEIAVEKATSLLKDDTNILIAVGSGTIHDITRYVAYQKGIPFISVPTAASVDGFVSTVAAMTWYGFKKTLIAVSPLYVFADSNIFSKAPYRLTASGISDLLGKYIAIADWKIAHLVADEYICDYICQLEMEAVSNVSKCLKALLNGEISAYEQLMYALILSGLAMQMVGNSRPASGAEHHISHLWEMEVINEHIDAYHGEKVSVGLVLCIKIYQQVKEQILAKQCTVKKYSGLDINLLKNSFQKESLYAEILKENTPDPLSVIDEKVLSEKLDDIAKVLEDLPTQAEIESLITTAKCVMTVSDIGLTQDIISQTIAVSPYVRNRLTLMRLIKMLNVELKI